MNLQRCKIFSFIACISITLSNTSWGIYKQVHSEKDFYSKLKDFPFSIVLFTSGKDIDKQTRRSMQSQKKVFKQLSASGFYQEAQLQFLVVEINSTWMELIAQDYQINQFPAFMLFVDGISLKDEYGTIQRQGYACESELKKYIKDTIYDDLEKNVQRRAQLKQEAREQAEYDSYSAPNSYINFSYNPYWGNPYYGYPYYGGNYGYWNGCGLRYGGWGGYNGYGGGPGFGFGVTVPVR